MNAILSDEDITNAMDLRCIGLLKRIWIERLQYHTPDWLRRVAAGRLDLALYPRVRGFLGASPVDQLSISPDNSQPLILRSF